MTLNERVVVLCFFMTLICSLNLTSPSNSTGDTLIQGQNLTSTSCLISSSGSFKLCFFQPDGSLDNKFYLGILSQNYYIWVANRDMPIHGPGYLTIDEHGNLKILSTKEHTTIVLYNSSVEAETSTTNVSATLLDTGNFVLRETNRDGSVKKVLWQSFDYPSDTLIPGMKLGFDREKGKIWSLTSRRSETSVSSGSFTLGLDPKTGNQLVMWWRGKILWTSGNWSSGRFSNLNSSLYAQDFNFTYFSNGRMTYFTCASVFGFVNIGPAGSINGASGASYSCLSGYFLSGCSRPASPKCREDVGLYLPSSNSFGVMSRGGFKFDESENLTISDCWMKCLNDCSCEAYTYANFQDQTGCEIWGTGAANYLLNNATDEGRNIFFFHSTGTNGKKSKVWIISGLVAGALLLLISSFTCFKLLRKHKERAENRKQQTNFLYDNMEGNTIFSIAYDERREQSNEETTSDDAHIFDFETILEATDNFSFSNKIGEGGFGPVYKGKLPNGQKVAVKRLSKSSGQGLVEFKNEAMLIVKLQHTNLVRLLGFCIHREERILVYEYMPNKSLNLYLFDSNKRSKLEWKIRCRIIEGIAQGLVYLHQYSRLKVIHRDLKASNILLDDELNPKISDFGTARIFGLIESEERTKRIIGTYGYMAPEYAMMGLISTKIDVYSFGILLLEIVSGKKISTDYPLNLVVYAWKLWNEGEALKLVDTMLEGSCFPIQVLKYIHIGLLCTQDQARDRPTMIEVISFFSNETAHLPPPKQPGFYPIPAMDETEHDKIYSTNDVTVSMISGR